MDRHHASRVHLQAILELSDGTVTRDMSCQRRGGKGCGDKVVIYVATQAARVVTKAIAGGVVLDAKLGVHGTHEGPKTDGEAIAIVSYRSYKIWLGG